MIAMIVANEQGIGMTHLQSVRIALETVAAVVFLSASQLPAAAACPELQVAAASAEDQFDDLAATRAVRVVDPYSLEMRHTDDAVRAYLSVRSSPLEAGERGLIFYVNVDPAVCGYYWTSRDGAPLRTFQLVADARALSELVEKALRAVSTAAAPIERRARLRSESRSAEPLPELSPMATEDTDVLLRRLSDALFPQDLRGELRRLSSLTIVPAINIGTVPFAALDPDGDGVPLVETTIVNVEAALRDVRNGRIYGIGQRIAPQTVAGDPDATDDHEWFFPRLPGAAKEAMMVAERFETTAIIGPDATVDEVAPKMAGAEYIHIAAHGFSSADQPIDGSFLALTGGRLTARDIQAMQFTKNPLVVLSACQTGLGGTLDAGIIGLARAFMFAGASSVVASLWNVDDGATSWIMVRFAENLAAHAPADALRLAQQEARARWPDPKTWAAFVLFGSRTVTFAGEPAPAERLPLDANFLLARRGASERAEIDLSMRTTVAPGDEIYIKAFNRSDRSVDVDLIFLDSEGEVSNVDIFRIDPGAPIEKRLVAVSDLTSGHESLIATFMESDPGSELPGSRSFEDMPVVPMALAMVGSGAIDGLLPATGISHLTEFGLSREPNLTGRRRAIAVVSLDVQSGN